MIIVMMVAWTTTPAAFLEVTPSSISFALQRGSSRTILLSLNGTASNVTLSATGEIKSWVSFSKNDFDISGIEVVNVMFFVPSTAMERVYTGNIQINYVGGKKTIPVIINVTTIPTHEVQHPIRFGDFSVSYELGSEVLASKENFEVSRGYFSDYPATLTHASLTDEKFSMVTGGYISVVIDETNNAGNFIIELNGKEIYNKNTYPGEVLINLNKSQIQKSNRVTLKAGLPGWKFWMSTVYKISSAKFGIDYLGVSKRDFVFDVSQNELDNFKYAYLSLRTKETTPTKDLIIEINGEELFKGGIEQAKLFSQALSKEMLKAGTNSISFHTEPNGFYELADVTLTIVYTA